MYSTIFSSSTTSGIRGTHYAPGGDHVYYVQNGNGSQAAGLILRIRVTPLEQISGGSKLITSSPETQLNLDAGSWDIRWTTLAVSPLPPGTPKIARNTTGSVTLYKYPSAPNGGLAGIDPASLPSLSYSSAPLAENGQGDTYYAARLGTGSPNYAVFRVYKDPNDPTKTRIDWITYKLNSNPDFIGFGYDDPRDIVISDDFSNAYVSARDENGQDRVLCVPNPSTNPLVPSFHVFGASSGFAIDDPAQPLDNPQQLALHNGNVYVVDAQGLWSIDLAAGVQALVVAIPNGGMGLLIDDLGMAIVTDMVGTVFRVDLQTAVAAPLSTLPGVTGFLCWTDDSKAAFYAPILAPDNTVRVVDAMTGASTLLFDMNTLGPPAPTPWSVEVLAPSRVFVASDTECGTLSLSVTGTALVLGIGLVPFDYIVQDPVSVHRGKANTTPATGYFYQVNNVPFGGSLNLMINHATGYTLGLRHYRVKFKHIATNVTRWVTDPFTDLLWMQVGGSPKFFPSPVTSTGPTPAAPTPANAFPVRNPNDLWYNPHLGAILHTRLADNGLNEITLEFFDQSGNLVPAQTKSYVVLIDNNRCNAILRLPRMGNPPPATYPVMDCGCITYTSKNDKVELDFSAWQVDGQGAYTISFYRGGQHLPALAQSGAVDTTAIVHVKSTTTLGASPTFKVGHMTGDCNIAGISVALSVPPRVIDGYRWLPTSYAQASLYFTLVPNTVPMSAPWVDPGG